MAGKRRYGRPNRGDLMGMMLVNAAVSCVLLYIIFTLFGIDVILPEQLAKHGMDVVRSRWIVVWPMLPGAGIGFACLWYWMIVVGRYKTFPWGGALFYGLAIACVNVPISGFFAGLVLGGPLLAMLIFLVMLLMLPTLFLSMVAFGLTMGLFNGMLAQRWIERFRSP